MSSFSVEIFPTALPAKLTSRCCSCGSRISVKSVWGHLWASIISFHEDLKEITHKTCRFFILKAIALQTGCKINTTGVGFTVDSQILWLKLKVFVCLRLEMLKILLQSYSNFQHHMECFMFVQCRSSFWRHVSNYYSNMICRFEAGFTNNGTVKIKKQI